MTRLRATRFAKRKFIRLFFALYDPSVVSSLDQRNGNSKASGKKRLTSIEEPANKPNHIAATTGAVERYIFTCCIKNPPLLY